MQLLERETHLQALANAIVGVRSGTGSIALVYGEAGIGKTSLVEHFLRTTDNSWRVLRGACDALFTPRPLGPLRDIAEETAGVLLERLEAGTDRNAIFTACLNELQGQSTIMLVEDIHWADEATLDLLKYLGRRIRQTRALLILTYRDDELAVDHPVRRLLGDLGNSAALQRIPVLPLSQDAVGALAGDRKFDAAELHRLTNGNPFFVTEVLAAEGGIPETIRDAVLARAAGLSPAARRALEAAAVIGQRIEPWLLSRIAEADAAHAEECIAAGMLQAQGELYAFRNELARHTLVESLAPHRRAALHRLALNALRERGATRPDLARLANHAEGTGDSDAVLEYAPAAARQASTASAHREAVVLYELALQFADSLSPADHAQLLEACIQELNFANRIHDCVRLCTEAIALRRDAGDSLAQGADLANLAVVQCILANKQEAEEAVHSAISLLEALPESPELGRAYKARCFIEMMDRECAEAVRWGERAIGLAERFGDMDTLARACHYAGCAQMLLDYEGGTELMRRSLAVGREANLPFAVAGAATNLAQMSIELYHFSDAHRVLQEGIAYAWEHDDDYHWRFLQILKALVALYEGHWAQAAATLASVLQTRSIDREGYTYGLITTARLRVREGKVEPEELQEALALSLESEALPRMAYSRAARAEAAWLAGETDRGIDEARATYDLAVTKAHPWIAGELAFWRWRSGDDFTPPTWIAPPFAAQIAGDWQEAADLWAQIGCPYERGMALTDGDKGAQLEALKIFEELGARPMLEKLKQQMRAKGVRGIPRGPRPSTRGNAYGLTARELDVLAALVTGAANIVIAKQLSLSSRTVEHHVAAILQKTSTQSRSEVIALALRDNLVKPG